MTTTQNNTLQENKVSFTKNICVKRNQHYIMTFMYRFYDIEQHDANPTQGLARPNIY